MRRQIVQGGGFRLLTADAIMIAVVRRCAELERENRNLRDLELGRFRTLRRDVRRIRRVVVTRKRLGGNKRGEL